MKEEIKNVVQELVMASAYANLSKWRQPSVHVTRGKNGFSMKIVLQKGVKLSIFSEYARIMHRISLLLKSAGCQVTAKTVTVTDALDSAKEQNFYLFEVEWGKAE